MSLADLRRRQSLALARTEECRQHSLTLRRQLEALQKRLLRKELSLEAYQRLITRGLDGKSFSHYLEEYARMESGWRERAEELEEGIRRERRKRSLHLGLGIAMMLVLLGLVAGPSLTGQVIFSLVETGSVEGSVESVGEGLGGGWSLSQDANLSWDSGGRRLTGVLVSGSYEGEGLATITLAGSNGTRLVFAADNSTLFSGSCVSSCHVEGLEGPYRLRVELPMGARIRIDRLETLSAELQEFLLSPSTRNVTLSPEERYLAGSFLLENREGGRKELALYPEGELSAYLTLNRSRVLLESGESARIGYALDLPREMEAGSYEQRIIAQFLPEDGFTGIPPREGYAIHLRVLEEKEGGKERKAPPRGRILIALLTLLLIAELIVILRKKR